MRIVVAPDKFRGTLDAAAAAAAMATGVRAAIPDADIVVVPLADGGEGTAAALGLPRHPCRARDPLLRPVPAAWYGNDDLAAVDIAGPCGHDRVGRNERRVLDLSTEGLGDLLEATFLSPAPTVLVGLGGSATMDAATGCARALGARLVDSAGRPLPPGPAALARLHAVEPVRPRIPVVALCDVRTPLLGPGGCARVFGPQKGASPADVEALEEAYTRFADIVEKDVGLDVRAVPRGGAAGGAGAGLAALLSASLADGAAEVARVVGLEAAIAGADLLLTGEGSFDTQSAEGKAPAHALSLAAAAHVPAVVVAGRVSHVPPGVRVVAVVDTVGEGRALGDAAAALADTVRHVLRTTIATG